MTHDRYSAGPWPYGSGIDLIDSVPGIGNASRALNAAIVKLCGPRDQSATWNRDYFLRANCTVRGGEEARGRAVSCKERQLCTPH